MLCDEYQKNGNFKEISQLLITIRPFLLSLPKAKSAKLVRSLVDAATSLPNHLEEQLKLVEDSLKWAITVKRSFLRQRLQLKYSYLLYQVFNILIIV